MTKSFGDRMRKCGDWLIEQVVLLVVLIYGIIVYRLPVHDPREKRRPRVHKSPQYSG